MADTVESLRTVQWVRRYRLPLLSALALILTFFPWEQEWLIWLAFVPFFVWLGEPPLTRRSAITGSLLVGALWYASLLAPLFSIGWWGWGRTTVEGHWAYASYQQLFMAGLVGMVSLCGGCWLAVGGLLVRPHLMKPLTALWLVPCTGVLVEYLGHLLVFGFTWGLIGNRLHGHETLRQVASLTGVYGLSFLVFLGNTLIASWLIYWRSRRLTSPQVASSLSSLVVATLLGVALFSASVLYGHRVMQTSESPGPVLRATLVQGALPEYGEEDFTPEGLDRLYSGSIVQGLSEATDLLVLPETVWLRTLALDKTTSPWATQRVSPVELGHVLAGYLESRPTLVIFGIDTLSGSRLYNATTFWTAEGLVGLYRKRRLVPFSEYRPAVLGRWAPQNLIHGPGFAYARGRGSQLVRAQGLVFGAFICQEVLFPSLVRETVRDGAQLLVTTGNDGVFSSPIVAHEQANLAQLRAIEHGRYLLRCMKTGVSAIIDPSGRVLGSGPFGDRAIVRGTVHPSAQMTAYTRFGDWIVWVSALAVGLSLLVRFTSRRRLTYNERYERS